MVKIRPADISDFQEIWRIFQVVIAGGDTYVNDEETSEEEAKEKYFGKSVKTFVAEIDGKIVGCNFIKPNRVGRGSHVANAGFIVDQNHRGQGIGKALALHSIAAAKELNYRAIQFNFVVSTNIVALKLWKSVGFKIIGTATKAFKHKDLGYVDAHIMFLDL